MPRGGATRLNVGWKSGVESRKKLLKKLASLKQQTDAEKSDYTGADFKGGYGHREDFSEEEDQTFYDEYVKSSLERKTKTPLSKQHARQEPMKKQRKSKAAAAEQEQLAELEVSFLQTEGNSSAPVLSKAVVYHGVPHTEMVPARIANLMNMLASGDAALTKAMLDKMKLSRTALFQVKAQLTNFRSYIDSGLAGLDYMQVGIITLKDQLTDVIDQAQFLMKQTWLDVDAYMIGAIADMKMYSKVVYGQLLMLIGNPWSGYSQFCWIARYMSQYFTIVELMVMYYNLAATPFQYVKHIPDMMADSLPIKQAWFLPPKSP